MALLNIYIIDDEVEITNILTAALMSEGYLIKCFNSAKDALSSLNDELLNNGKERLPLVITDCMMPGMDGFEMLKIMRMGEFSSIPVILMSGKVDEQEIIEMAHYKVSGVILKPFSPDQLVSRISSLIDKKTKRWKQINF